MGLVVSFRCNAMETSSLYKFYSIRVFSRSFNLFSLVFVCMNASISETVRGRATKFGEDLS